jgi:hypothetical protein
MLQFEIALDLNELLVRRPGRTNPALATLFGFENEAPSLV